MYLKTTFFTFALVSSLVAAQPPHGHPNCTVGTDTQSCSLPDGGAGMFLCHPHPPHGGPRGRHGHGGGDGRGGGIGGSILRVVDRLTGNGPPPHDEAHGPHHPHGPHGDHHHGDHHHDGHHGPHRQLRSGSSSSSSSSSSSRSGPPSWRSGPPSFDEGRHGRHGRHGKHGKHGGKHGCHGPPGFLSPTKCVPVDGPPKDHHHPPFHGGPHNPPTCGCCGDVCPAQLDCGCTCDLKDREGNAIEDGKGVWATVTMKDQKTTVKKCVPAGAYADANRVQCVKECSADMVEDEDSEIEITEERFGDDEGIEDEGSAELMEERFGDDEDLEKESRD